MAFSLAAALAFSRSPPPPLGAHRSIRNSITNRSVLQALARSSITLAHLLLKGLRSCLRCCCRPLTLLVPLLWGQGRAMLLLRLRVAALAEYSPHDALRRHQGSRQSHDHRLSGRRARFQGVTADGPSSCTVIRSCLACLWRVLCTLSTVGAASPSSLALSSTRPRGGCSVHGPSPAS